MQQEKRTWPQVVLGRFGLGSRKDFFTERMIRCWNRLLKEVVEAAILKVCKRCVDMAPEDLAVLG